MIITGPCSLCYYARPLYKPETKTPIVELDGRAVLVCVFNTSNALPVVKPNWDVAERFGWSCFEPIPYNPAD